jgi:hypothetical protein
MLPMAIAARWDDYFKKEIVDQHFHKKCFCNHFGKMLDPTLSVKKC